MENPLHQPSKAPPAIPPSIRTSTLIIVGVVVLVALTVVGIIWMTVSGIVPKDVILIGGVIVGIILPTTTALFAFNDSSEGKLEARGAKLEVRELKVNVDGTLQKYIDTSIQAAELAAKLGAQEIAEQNALVIAAVTKEATLLATDRAAETAAKVAAEHIMAQGIERRRYPPPPTVVVTPIPVMPPLPAEDVPHMDTGQQRRSTDAAMETVDSAIRTAEIVKEGLEAERP